MPQTPDSLLERPTTLDGRADVLSEVLRSLRIGNMLYGRFELGAPWGIRMPAVDGHVGFYVLARGAALFLGDDGGELTLSGGDVAIVLHGSAHRLRDTTGRRVAYQELGGKGCGPLPVRFGGEGAMTSLLAGCFRFGEPADRALLSGLPPVIHLRDDDPRVASTAQLLIAESGSPDAGSSVLMSRLADVLFVQALRSTRRAPSCAQPGLMRALADPLLGGVLARMHAAPAEPWTVERLAATAAMSRSAFAARFHACLGEAPLAYLARWRMARAAELLRTTELGTPEVAARVGYASEAAFNRAFKRFQAVGPGAYRRAHRRPAASLEVG